MRYIKHQRKALPTMPAPNSVPAQPMDICGIRGLKSSDLHILQSPSLHVSNSPTPNPRMPRPPNLQAFKSPSFQIIKGRAGGRGVAIQIRPPSPRGDGKGPCGETCLLLTKPILLSRSAIPPSPRHTALPPDLESSRVFRAATRC